MKITIVLAMITTGIVHLGMTELAELVYVVTAAAAWTYGGRAINEAMSRDSVRAVRSTPRVSLRTLADLS